MSSNGDNTPINNSDSSTYSVTGLNAKSLANARRNHSSTLSAKERANLPENQADFYADGGILFCKSCSTPVEFSRQSNLAQHISSQGHKKRAILPPAKKQKTLTTTFPVPNSAKLAKLSFITDYHRMLIATNTPFNTVNNPLTQKIFQSHVKSGGALPCSQQLYPFVHDIHTVEKESLQSKIQDCQIVIIFDETVDNFGHKVCSVMFSLITKLNKPCIFSYVASVYFEKAALNYNRVAQLVLKTVHHWK